MKSVELVSLVIILILQGLIGWYAMSLHRTTSHRADIIANAIMSFSLMSDIARVPYSRHFWFVFFFKDYRRLYSSATWRANGWSRK